jgi:hypothetical protein
LRVTDEFLRTTPDRQATALVVVEPQSPPTDLCAQNPILLAQIGDGLLLLVVHPAGNGDQQQPEGIQGLGHLQSLASPSARLSRTGSGFWTLRGQPWQNHPSAGTREAEPSAVFADYRMASTA